MRTLDKMWKHMQPNDNDIVMGEDEQKAETILDNQEQSNNKTTKNDDNNEARANSTTTETSFTFTAQERTSDHGEQTWTLQDSFQSGGIQTGQRHLS